RIAPNAGGKPPCGRLPSPRWTPKVDDEGAVPHESKERRRKAAGQGETDHGVAPGPVGEAKPCVQLARTLVSRSTVDVHYHVAGGPREKRPVSDPAVMPHRFHARDNVVVFLEQVREVGHEVPGRLAAHGKAPFGQGHDVSSSEHRRRLGDDGPPPAVPVVGKLQWLLPNVNPT